MDMEHRLKDTAPFLGALGIPVCEGWGVCECVCVCVCVCLCVCVVGVIVGTVVKVLFTENPELKTVPCLFLGPGAGNHTCFHASPKVRKSFFPASAFLGHSSSFAPILFTLIH